MRIQLLSDLHLETEVFEPTPAPRAELLVLAGDIDATWRGYRHFVGWPVPVLVVAGNHEFDGRDLADARPRFADHCAALGLKVLEHDTLVMEDSRGRRIRFLGTTRWTDFDVFGHEQRDRSMKVGTYFQRVMQAHWQGQPFDTPQVRMLGLQDRAWLVDQLALPAAADASVVVTHFAPSLRSADPRYGHQLSTSAFCNADDDLIERADLWLHGHVHCRHDYRVGNSRVVSQARGLQAKGETLGHDPHWLIEV